MSYSFLFILLFCRRDLSQPDLARPGADRARNDVLAVMACPVQSHLAWWARVGSRRSSCAENSAAQPEAVSAVKDQDIPAHQFDSNDQRSWRRAIAITERAQGILGDAI